MLKKTIKKLNRYRAEKDTWNQLAWVEDRSGEGCFDKNEEERTEILIALQFDQKQADEAFIRFLMTEEIKSRKNDPYQGCSDNLNRVGFLLADFRNPLNVDLFVQAKTANFDTHCGFDWEHLLSAGVEKTFKQIQQSPKNIKKAFHSYFKTLDSCELTEKDIENWLDNKRNNRYPRNFSELDTEYLIDLAFKFDDLSTAKELVDEYDRRLNGDINSFLTLKYYRGRLKDYKAQIAIAEKLLDFPQNDDSRACYFFEIARLHLILDQIDLSWLSIKKAIALSKNLEKGRLGQIAEMCTDIVNHSKEEYPFLKECYQFGITHLGHFQSPDQIKNKFDAATKMKDKATAKYFKNLASGA